MLRWAIFLVIGFWQFFAVLDGLEAWYGLHGIVAIALGFFIAQLPIIGSVVGMYSANNVWDWSLLQATLLFFGPFVLVVLFCILEDRNN
ncbi:TPA: hypothetical protein ACT9LS_002109 [Legionella pneumophila]|nr:hypothetical protein [Legionella pneumophila]HAT8123898.1 hypothetical protein [Legionella pneumophila]HAU0773267.1 hypothetical protein [Legionella pneumophila]HAU0871347.1 hypothetical protein [Legionella pneumophila]HAU0889659.1 hypothetical protein [Legionella pneumophila]